MSRIKIDLPDSFSFTAVIPIRITDINYGNHVGNDAVLSIIHEARMQFLSKHGYTELNLEDVDTIEIKIAATDFTAVGFDLYYLLEKQKDTNRLTVAIAKTGMLCYDYARKKITAVPATVKEKLMSK